MSSPGRHVVPRGREAYSANENSLRISSFSGTIVSSSGATGTSVAAATGDVSGVDTWN